jgi:LysM repeat protein
MFARLRTVLVLVLLVGLAALAIPEQSVQALATISSYNVTCTSISVSGSSTAPFVGLRAYQVFTTNIDGAALGGAPQLADAWFDGSPTYPVTGGHYSFTFNFSVPTGTPISFRVYGATTADGHNWDGQAFDSVAATSSCAAPVGGCDTLVNIPSTAVGGTFVANAPLYFAPGRLVEPAQTIAAGNTARVIGLDSTRQYYEIIWVCDFLWVPANTIGPNYDQVWHGRPLPTEVVFNTGTSGVSTGTGSSTIVAPGNFPVNSAPVNATTYMVHAGDNLFRIALHFGVSLSKLASVNGISNPSRIYVGQVLNIAAAR